MSSFGSKHIAILFMKLREALQTSYATDLLTFLLVICVFWCHFPIYSLTETKNGGRVEVGTERLLLLYQQLT